MIQASTDISGFDLQHQAAMLMKVDHKATNAFFQQVRRRISILERPLVTARREGKSYIYANFNPKYAQMAVTILRCYYNFCVGYKKKGVRKTPAEWLGIADRQYDLHEILYFK